jgi:hypothetical protein
MGKTRVDPTQPRALTEEEKKKPMSTTWITLLEASKST